MAVPVMWRTQKQRYSLQGEVCGHCANTVFPPRAVCPYCKQAMHASASVTPAQAKPAQGREFVYTMPIPTVLVAAAGDD